MRMSLMDTLMHHPHLSQAPRSAPNRPLKRRAHGATLIEVLVSLLIVSFGMLALLALQNNAIRYTKTTEYRSVATMLATDLGERMRANRPGAVASNYNLVAAYTAPAAMPARTACPATPCAAAADLATQDLGEWQRLLYINLPGGAGYVEYDDDADGDGTATAVNIWVAWADPGGSNEVAGNTDNDVRECPVAFVAADTPNPPRCAFFRIALPPA
jgi:type IV pilus assembly protein PilV